MLWLIIRAVWEDVFHGQIFRILSNHDVPWRWKACIFQNVTGVYCYTVVSFRFEERKGHINGHEYNLPRAYTQDHSVLRRQYYSEKLAKGEHIADLRRIFNIMREHQLKMNPTKSFLGVANGKFLGFVVTSKGIQLDLEKVCAIQEMQHPRNLRKLKRLQGRLAYIRRFVLNLSGRCQPFNKLMKKGVSFIWDNACQDAFEEIKQYLTHNTCPRSSVSGRPFLIYV